ncbi:MAG: amidohydrolase [Desulfobacterales bacterium]|nr:amidohydrolase [Desulfobacterales bacterium]MCP4162790.1 amidohydrolase [Deltaproteobacteria bacterium]
MKSEIYKLAKKYFEETVRIRRKIHENPETGFDVYETASLVVKELSNTDFEVREGVGKTGVVFDLTVPGASRRVALRADMDALNMQEMGDNPYKSKVDGKAHMCGHDCHTSILITVGKILNDIKEKLTVNVRLIFQPCEETLPGGAVGMIEDGAINEVDEIYGLHVWTDYRVGSIGLKAGAFMAQPDSFEITVKGKGGHAAMPHLTNDPIIAGCSLVQSLNTIVSRNIDPVKDAVLSVTQFNSGTSDNIIPEFAKIIGTVRTFDSDTKDIITNRMDTVLKGISETYDVSCDMVYLDGYPVNFNDNELTEKFVGIADSIIGEENINFPVPPFMGAEDFGYYSRKIPSCFFLIGCGNPEKNIIHSVHDPLFDVDEDFMLHGVALMAGIVLLNK